MTSLRKLRFSICLVFVNAFAFVGTCAFAAEPTEHDVEFGRDVQPILKAHCVACHGPQKQESNYRLDVREIAFAPADYGTAPIVKGKSAESPVYLALTDQHEDGLVMPPPDEAEPLSEEAIATIKRWIDAGAPWPDELAGDSSTELTTDHWAFQPIESYTPPAHASSLGKTSIDAFLGRRLEQAGLSFSPAADRVTWLRRVYLDMHGLPPTQEQLNAFVHDTSPNAYQRVIDDVLGSHHYGERWARHWLDVVRFGESTGFEVNRDRENAYYFRDYVIDAFNKDTSYRQFIIDQLAGDVAGNEIGTGFLVGGPYDMVKSPDINLTLMQRQDELADFVNTTGTAFLGMTIGCARCHTHKFDPIPQRDYYAMQAVFAGVQHGERPLQGESANEHRQRIEALEQNLREMETQLNEYRELAKQSAESPLRTREPVNAKLNTEDFPAVLASAVRFTISQTNASEPCIDELEIFAVADQSNVALASAGTTVTASGSLSGHDIHQLKHINDGQIGNQHSWISSTNGEGWVQLEFPEPVAIHRIRWGRDRLGGFRDRVATVYRIEAKTPDDGWCTVASSADRKPFGGEADESADFVEYLPEESAKAAADLLHLRLDIKEQIRKAQASIPKAYLGTFTEPAEIHRLHRGDPLAPREVVAPGALSIIGPLDLATDSESSRRLALAEWIASPDNPLTARVIVNRVWQFHFGTGIVNTPSDFGRNGGEPSHPELLDWLAHEFMQNGWSMKWLHRQILSSHAYQQSSDPSAEGLAKDAASRLLWRFPPRRLSAEAIRDCVLHVSGALNLKRGGPGFLLFEINHENVHHYFPLEEYGPEQFRRMIYMTKIRQEQDDVFGVFDCPDGGQVIPSRNRSTTPLQALNLLNSQFVLDQADRFSNRIQKEHPQDVANQIGYAFQLAFSRPPNQSELEAATALVQEHGLPALCRAMLNANEFLFVF